MFELPSGGRRVVFIYLHYPSLAMRSHGGYCYGSSAVDCGELSVVWVERGMAFGSELIPLVKGSFGSLDKSRGRKRRQITVQDLCIVRIVPDLWSWNSKDVLQHVRAWRNNVQFVGYEACQRVLAYLSTTVAKGDGDFIAVTFPSLVVQGASQLTL